MAGGVILLHVAIAIAAVIALILWVRLNPAIALVLGAIYLGIATGQGLTDTVNRVGQGFGGLMTGIGLAIGFGVLLGTLTAEAGGVQRIAQSLLALFGRERSGPALAGTGLVVSTPVFYDVGYVILAPLARSISAHTGAAVGLMGSALVFGLGMAHTFIPPTPGPLAGAELLGVPLGVALGYGVLISIPTVAIGMWIYGRLFARGLWNPARDEEEQIFAAAEAAAASEQVLPSLGMSLLPIVLPIVLILLGTVTAAVGWSAPWIDFLSHRITALLLGVLAAYWLAARVLPRERLDRAVTEGVRASGLVLLITGAGGSLGAVLGATGVGEYLGGLFSTATYAPLLLVWALAGLLKIAQGSGTVAMITAAGLMAPAVPALGIAPVLVALAAFSGSLFGAHINDSGFWITTKMLGLSTQGGFKVYTLPCAIMSVVSLVLILLLGLVL